MKTIETTCNVKGEVTETDHMWDRMNFIHPVEHHYENEGETPYIKYGCPICESLGSKFSISYGTNNCPSCNINLIWESEN